MNEIFKLSERSKKYFLGFEGPGCSSIGVGAFVEHGPFKPAKKGLMKNDYSWNKG